MSENGESTEPKKKLTLAPKVPGSTPPLENEEPTPAVAESQAAEPAPAAPSAPAVDPVAAEPAKPAAAAPVVKPTVVKPTVKPLARPGIVRTGTTGTATPAATRPAATPTASGSPLKVASKPAPVAVQTDDFDDLEEPQKAEKPVWLLVDLVAAGVAVAGAVMLYQEFLK